jgi:hypothetical protein
MERLPCPWSCRFGDDEGPTLQEKTMGISEGVSCCCDQSPFLGSFTPPLSDFFNYFQKPLLMKITRTQILILT